MILTGEQILQGRELAGMSQADLATAARVAVAVVIRAESVAHIPQVIKGDLMAIRRALEKVGVEFVQEKGGLGVRLRTAEPEGGEG